MLSHDVVPRCCPSTMLSVAHTLNVTQRRPDHPEPKDDEDTAMPEQLSPRFSVSPMESFCIIPTIHRDEMLLFCSELLFVIVEKTAKFAAKREEFRKLGLTPPEVYAPDPDRSAKQKMEQLGERYATDAQLAGKRKRAATPRGAGTVGGASPIGAVGGVRPIIAPEVNLSEETKAKIELLTKPSTSDDMKLELCCNKVKLFPCKRSMIHAKFMRIRPLPISPHLLPSSSSPPSLSLPLPPSLIPA